MATARFAILLFLSLGLSVFVHAQETWQGLKFQSTVADTQSDLAKKNYALRQVEVLARDVAVFELSPDYQLRAAGAIPKYPFKVEIRFYENALNMVTLQLDTAALKRDFALAANSPDVLASIAGSEIRQLLIAKYGGAVEEKGPCDKAEDPSIILGHTQIEPQCKALWKGDGQTIELSWWYHPSNKDYTLFLQYKPQSGL